MLSRIHRLKFSTLTKVKRPLFIKSGTVINHDSKFDADIQVVDGKIHKIGTSGLLEPIEGSKIIDASNKFVIPGGIETHSHL